MFWLKKGNKDWVANESQEESRKGKAFGDEKEEEIDDGGLEEVVEFCKGDEEEKCSFF